MKNPPSVTGRGAMARKTYGPLSAVRNKHLIKEEVDSQEYIYGELVGIRNSHLSMFPLIWERLQRAKGFDWNKKIVGPDETADARGYVVTNHGSFEAMYAALVEPWLGKYDSLREIVGKFERGEIQKPEAVQQISENAAKSAAERAQAAAEKTTGKVRPEGRPWPQKTDETVTTQIGQLSRSERAAKNGVSKGTQEKLDSLARRRPDLLEEVKAGRMSTHRAAVQAGIVKEPSKFEQIVKWLPALTAEERAKLKEML